MLQIETGQENRWWKQACRCLILQFFLHNIVDFTARAQMPDPPGQANASEASKHAAYLFAHMTHADYGRLYYSVSTDGLHWRSLNDSTRVFDDYRGHPDICRRPQGGFFLVGNRHDR